MSLLFSSPFFLYSFLEILQSFTTFFVYWQSSFTIWNEFAWIVSLNFISKSNNLFLVFFKSFQNRFTVAQNSPYIFVSLVSVIDLLKWDFHSCFLFKLRFLYSNFFQSFTKNFYEKKPLYLFLNQGFSQLSVIVYFSFTFLSFSKCYPNRVNNWFDQLYWVYPLNFIFLKHLISKFSS